MKKYNYDPDKARQLLAEAQASNMTLNFYYPTSADRPYMTNPKEIYDDIASDLQAVGIHIVGKAEPWEQYLTDTRDKGQHDLELLGFNGDYNDPGNFLGTLFGRERAEFSYNQPKLFNEISAADRESNPDKHAADYQQVNRDIMEKYLPAVPLVNSPPALVVAHDIRGLVASPMTTERFDTVYREDN